MGFGHQGIPIDIVGLFLVGYQAKKYSLLLVDEFHRFNKVSEEYVSLGLERTKRALENLSSLYKFRPEIIICSDFMKTQEYNAVLKDMEQQVKEKGLTDKLLETVPEKHRQSQDALVYPLNEVACVEFLRKTKGIEVKIGPSKEKPYDDVMQKLGLGISFAYVIDAYALGTREPEQVIHYVPTHKGKTNGQRLFLDESIHKAESKLLLGPEEALKYLLRLSSAAGYVLGKDCLTQEEIDKLNCRKLKKITRRFVLENIIKPYKEVEKNE